MFGSCQGDCSFVHTQNTCNILPDSSKCPSDNSTEIIECTCVINSQDQRFCYNCGATVVENEDGSTSTITISEEATSIEEEAVHSLCLEMSAKGAEQADES